jgi:acetolactate decarboxylase
MTLLVLVFLAAGCAPKPPATVFQNSTIDALLDGNYDGELTFGELKKHGDFGLGTFDAVDGEMLALEGEFYQMRGDGSVSRVPDHVKTPFSAVVFYQPTGHEFITGPVDYTGLQKRLDGHRTMEGHAYAFLVDGRFTSVKVRSVGKQKPPYPPLADVVKTQSVWELADVEGTLVGFWFPPSMKHVNVPGYHFHFITKDRKRGGHVLGVTVDRVKTSRQSLDAIHIALPAQPPATRAVSDRESELHKVEK